MRWGRQRMKQFDLSGKVAVVTGGTGVLGGAVAKGLAKAGAKVAILGRRENIAHETAERLREAGFEALALPADVLDKNSLETAKTKLLETYESCDILVNAAGGNKPQATVQPDGSFFDLDKEALEQVVALNLLGTILPCQTFGELMKERGSIINISSMAAQKPLTRVVGYAAAKAAIDNFTKWLAVEMATKYGAGLRVNAIAPGFFVGEQNRKLLLNDDGTLTARGQHIINHTPMRRFGEAEELVGTAVWLASDASTFVTGIIVPVDGGFSAFGGV
jgi:NAD(P)-dependent dehydrogenase (short-subunit alcohol dehydrogenase family)